MNIVESNDDLRILRLNLKIDDIPEASQNLLESKMAGQEALSMSTKNKTKIFVLAHTQSNLNTSPWVDILVTGVSRR